MKAERENGRDAVVRETSRTPGPATVDGGLRLRARRFCPACRSLTTSATSRRPLRAIPAPPYCREMSFVFRRSSVDTATAARDVADQGLEFKGRGFGLITVVSCPRKTVVRRTSQAQGGA